MPGKPWPASLAAREGILNVVSGRWLPALLFVVTVAVTAGLGLASALEVSRLVDAEAEWIEAGGYSYVVEPAASSDKAWIDVDSCERMRDVDGVEGAFALTVTDATAWPASAPGTSSTFAQASAGAYDFFGLDSPNTASVLVTSAALDATGMVDGEITTMSVSRHDGSTDKSAAEVRAIALDSPLLPDALAGTYVSIDLISGEAQQCYVQTDAAHDLAVRDYLAGALASGDAPANVRPRLSANTYGIDFETAYDNRALTWAWAAGGTLLALVWALIRWMRRSRLAIYSTFGADLRARLIMQMTEWTAITGPGSLWGWAIGVTFALGVGGDPAVVLTQVSGLVVATWSLASVLATLIGLVPVGTLIDALKDRT